MAGRTLPLLLALCGAAAALWTWSGIPLGTLSDPGPGLFPLVLAVTLTGLALAAAGQRPAAGKGGRAVAGRALPLAALLVAYPLGLTRLGFEATTLLIMALLAPTIDRRSLPRVLAFALLATAAAVVLFRHVLAVPLPRGPWGF
jgi:hypothetical protein